MEKKQLGESDLLVSKVCLGTMTFGEQNTKPMPTASSTTHLSAELILLILRKCTL